MSDPGPQVPVSTYTFRKFVVLIVAILALIVLLVLLLSTLPRRGTAAPSATPEDTQTPTEVAAALPSHTPTSPSPPSATPTARPSNTPRPTATETSPPPSDTPAPTATRQASPTPRPPTATRTPRPTATLRPATRVAEVTVPPTPSPLPPPTRTPVPPSATPRPPSATPRPTQPPTVTPVPPPDVTPHITSPAAGAAVPPGRLVISGLTGANTRIRVTDGSQVIGTTVSGASGSWTISVEGGLPAGSHVLRAEALDDGGAVEARSDDVPITVLETVTPTTGGEDLPWPVFLLMAGTLLALGLVITLGGAALRAWERTRRY